MRAYRVLFGWCLAVAFVGCAPHRAAQDVPAVGAAKTRPSPSTSVSAISDAGQGEWVSSYQKIRPFVDKPHPVELAGVVMPLSVQKGRRPGRIYVLALDDCTDVVISYSGLSESWRRWDGKRVCVRSKVQSYAPQQPQSLVMPHLLDPDEPLAPKTCGAQVPSGARRVVLTGEASDSKCCLAVMVEGTGRVLLPDVLGGAGAWPSTLYHTRVQVRGVLKREKMWPDPGVGPNGEISQGAFGKQWVLRSACVKGAR